MTDLQLLTVPARFRHLPTEVEAMPFTTATRFSLREWLTVELGREHFEMTDTHLLLETAQGDTDNQIGCWVIKAETPDGYEFYAVAPHVVANRYEQV